MLLEVPRLDCTQYRILHRFLQDNADTISTLALYGAFLSERLRPDVAQEGEELVPMAMTIDAAAYYLWQQHRAVCLLLGLDDVDECHRVVFAYYHKWAQHTPS